MTGAQAIVRCLEELGVTDVFGLPGGTILPTYDPLMETTKIRHILVRHEQGAGHAAEGYALATGKTGVAIATSGPGATNLVTALADANMDSIPMVAITGQVGSGLIGTDAFQEADIVGITMPITKHSRLVTRPEDIPEAMANAFYLANSGRPGPVLVDITKDAQQAEFDFAWPPALDLPGYRPVTKGHVKQVREAAKLFASSMRPVIYAGGGLVKADAAAELKEFAELTGAPVVTTLTARGVFPDSHPQHVGMPGMHGTVSAVAALQQSDLLITLGARFDDRVTGVLASFAPGAKVIHVDIDPAEISKNRVADVPIVGTLDSILPELTAEFTKRRDEGLFPACVRPTPWVTPPPRTARSPRSTSSSASANSPGPTPSTPPVWASTRCGPRSSSATSSPATGSTPPALAPWASASQQPWAPRWPARRTRCGASTATAASR
jgi:acetolactate synthase-1/2/3 large subunit